MDKRKLRDIERDIERIFSDDLVHSIILFGSHASGDITSRNDIDICIVAPKLREKNKHLKHY